MGLEMAIPGVIGGVVNALQTADTNRQNEQNMVENQQFTKTMSDTAHQREVADLKAAGLNPILSAGGSGASTPSSPMPSLQAPQIQLPDMMAYGISMKQLEQADAKIQIDRANSASSIAKNLSDVQINKLQAILQKQGLLGRELGTDTASKLQHIMGSMVDSVTKPNPKNLAGPPPSSGGSPTINNDNHPNAPDYMDMP